MRGLKKIPCPNGVCMIVILQPLLRKEADLRGDYHEQADINGRSGRNAERN